MPLPKKKKTRKEIFAQKRRNERKLYERMKNDPEATLIEKKMYVKNYKRVLTNRL